MSLQGEERKQYILKILAEKGKVNVNDLASELNVSTETIRKDLDQMDKENKLKKVYGGAVKISYDLIEPSQLSRENVHIEEKRKIGKAAADLVLDHEVIIVDEGSTTLQMIMHLSQKKNITLITNSVPALTLLIDYETKGLFQGTCVFIGGHVDSTHRRVTGLLAEQFMDHFYVDKAFISIYGITKDYGMTSYDPNEAILTKKFMKCARENIVLFDHSKIGIKRYYKVADLKEVDTIVCDKEAPMDWRGTLADKNIQWIVAE